MIIGLAQQVKEFRAQRDAERLRAEKAEREKAWISEKREKTAMVTASVAVRKNKKLEKENTKLKEDAGIRENYLAVTNIPWVHDYFWFPKHTGGWVVLGQHLTKVADEVGIAAIKIPDPKRPYNIYHVDVIKRFKEKLDADRSYCPNYRKSK